MKDHNETPLTERKVVRRGLLAGLAGLGAAAMMKLSGDHLARAANGEALVIGNTGAFPEPSVAGQTATFGTRLTVTGGNGIQVNKDGGSVFLLGAAALIGTDGSGTGILGSSLGSGTTGVGVQGQGTSGKGVFGITNAAGGIAVDGRAATDGTGIRGRSNTAGSGGFGDGNGIGVQGLSSGGPGVQGHSLTSFGVEGQATNVAGFGVRGVNSQNGIGIKGVSNTGGNTANDGTGNGIGVHGKSTGGNGVKGESSNAAGVFGQSVSQPGVEGISSTSLGVRGTSTHFVGVVGISTNSHGLYGYTTHPQGVGLVGDHGAGGLAGNFNGRVEVHGSFQVFGVKNAVLRMPDGTNASVYCQESPEPYFEDFGRAQLVGGVANVPLEREFAILVSGGDYMVFPVAEGETRGLFVSRRGPTSFEVREMQGGVGNVPFTYRIVTKRKDVEGRRFARVSDDGAKSVSAARAALGLPPASTGSPNPVNPPPFAPPANPVAPVPGDPAGPRRNGGPSLDGPR